MARRVVAVAIDTAVGLFVLYIAFRAAAWSAPCRDQGNCVVLTPLIVVFVIGGLCLYPGGPLLLGRKTLGQRLLRDEKSDSDNDEPRP
ncbi:MAG: hypothetical protein NVS4B2_10070 [Chloroflexota bacterium]